MITIYGSDQCPKTVKILELCKERGIEVNYRNFEKELKSIWEFVVIRDEDSNFDKTKKSKRLGIPAIVCENGHTFDGGEEPFDVEAVMRVVVKNAKD
ncbi:MAG: glutaredoxin [bacterium]|nr:glutaredoxin [bacterium]